MAESDDTLDLVAASTERAETVAQQDALLMAAVAELRGKLALHQLTDEELRQAANLVDEWRTLADQRLALAAQDVEIVGKVIVAGAPPAIRVSVLRAQAIQLESIASAVRVTAETLDLAAAVGVEVARRA